MSYKFRSYRDQGVKVKLPKEAKCPWCGITTTFTPKGALKPHLGPGQVRCVNGLPYWQWPGN